MSHDPTWAQFDVISRIYCRRQSFLSRVLVLLSLSNATQKRERELWVSEKRELWVKGKKNEEGEETEKNGERDVT